MKNITAMLLVFATLIFAAPETASQFLDTMQKTYDAFPALCANFTQTFVWTLADETQTLEGSICTKGSDKFKIDIPDQLIISDGKTLWTLNKVNNQVMIDTPGKSDNSNPLLKDFISKYLIEYDAVMDAAGSDKETTHLVLTAKMDNFVNKVEIWADAKSHTLKKIIQYDLNENQTIYEIKSMDTQVELANDTFKFTPAADMEIIDMR